MRKPDLIIGPRDNPQTLRWHLFRWRGWQLALHKWMRSDDDRALHDHSGHNMSVILNGGYWEIVRSREWADENTDYDKDDPKANSGWAHVGDGEFYREVDREYFRWPLVPYFRKAETPHRIKLAPDSVVWSLWLRWPPIREWGFWCPKGWRHWKEYCNTRDYSEPGSASEIGPGCD
jgi:hypothetical protein